MKHKQTIACDISTKVRRIVNERDSCDGAPCCIVCGTSYEIEQAHFISRKKGGLGIPENLACMCKKHHNEYDEKGKHKAHFERYLRLIYPEWDKGKLVYEKYK
ncbi:MAG: hypothetical protein ABFD50_14085 [Smithella sp.]